MSTPVQQTFGRRVSVDLSPDVDIDIRQLEKLTNMSTADLFRSSLSMLKLYLEAREQGRNLMIVDKQHPENTVRIELANIPSSKK